MMHEVKTTVHISAQTAVVWRSLCLSPRSPILASLALHNRLHPVMCPAVGDAAIGERTVCHYEEGTVEEEVVEYSPPVAEAPGVVALQVTGGTLNTTKWLTTIRDRFTLEPNGDGVRLTRTTEFLAGRDLHRVATLPMVKRQIRRLQFRFLGDVKLQAERQAGRAESCASF